MGLTFPVIGLGLGAQSASCLEVGKADCPHYLPQDGWKRRSRKSQFLFLFVP